MSPLSAEDPGDSNCLEDEEPEQECAGEIVVEKCENMKAGLEKQ